MNTICHWDAWFSGRVQGVGFCYTVLQVAKGYEVTGNIQNLADGRVLLESEGPEDELAAFLEDIKDTLSFYIKEVEISKKAEPSNMQGFIIA